MSYNTRSSKRLKTNPDTPIDTTYQLPPRSSFLHLAQETRDVMYHQILLAHPNSRIRIEAGANSWLCPPPAHSYRFRRSIEMEDRERTITIKTFRSLCLTSKRVRADAEVFLYNHTYFLFEVGLGVKEHLPGMPRDIHPHMFTHIKEFVLAFACPHPYPERSYIVGSIRIWIDGGRIAAIHGIYWRNGTEDTLVADCDGLLYDHNAFKTVIHDIFETSGITKAALQRVVRLFDRSENIVAGTPVPKLDEVAKSDWM